jgi:hypothetical protein
MDLESFQRTFSPSGDVEYGLFCLLYMKRKYLLGALFPL